MSQFEVVALTLSFVLGLSMSHLLWAAAAAVDTVIGDWTWSWYLQFLALGVLLFASGALVLPSESQQRSGDLFDAGNYANIALAAFAVVGLTVRRTSIQWISVVGFGLVVVWASVFVWTGGAL